MTLYNGKITTVTDRYQCGHNVTLTAEKWAAWCEKAAPGYCQPHNCPECEAFIKQWKGE